MILAWWASLSVFLKVLWGITIASTLIFVIQTVMTFIGADLGGDIDTAGLDGLDATDITADISDVSDAGGHSGMNLYTFRNLVNFMLGFGWTSVLLHDQIPSKFALILIATLVGIGLVVLVMLLFKWLNGMQQSGNIDVWKSAVGCQGKVYLTIPAERGGEGKIQVSINDAVREYNAITDGDEIKTGTPIKIIEVINAETMLVEELNSLII